MPRFSVARRCVLLDRAAASLRVVKIDYTDVDGSTTTRRIAIDKILTSKTGDAYLVAYCFLRREVRNLRVDRIRRHRTLRRTYGVEDLEMAA